MDSVAGYRPRGVLAEIGDRQFRSRDDSPGNLPVWARDARVESSTAESCRIRRWCGRGLRGDTCHRGENENSPKNRIPDDRPH